MGDICGDNRLEIIAKAKAKLLESTNIETSEDEMKVLDNFLFRCWQMGWLDRYDSISEVEFAMEWADFDFSDSMNDIIRKRIEENKRRVEQTLEGAMIHTGVVCPDGYIFKDENGNVINATKIVLEKKKKEYPKTFEECCKILGLLNVDLCFNADYRSFDASKEQWKRLGLTNQFYQLLICRDAYWKIAGDEMGLSEPWKPDWKNSEESRYCIVNIEGDINLPERTLTKWILKVTNKILVFPTEEMRDAFKENFDPDIEFCKELL